MINLDDLKREINKDLPVFDKNMEILLNYLASRGVIPQWQPIETCPKDSTWFLALIEGIPYKCKAFMNGDVVNYHWCMHANMASGQVLRIERNDDGTEKRIQIREAGEPRYEPRILGYKLGMNHIPSHWMPLPPQKGEK